MATFLLDSSAIAKRYVAEVGTTWRASGSFGKQAQPSLTVWGERTTLLIAIWASLPVSAILERVPDGPR